MSSDKSKIKAPCFECKHYVNARSCKVIKEAEITVKDGKFSCDMFEKTLKNKQKNENNPE